MQAPDVVLVAALEEQGVGDDSVVIEDPGRVFPVHRRDLLAGDAGGDGSRQVGTGRRAGDALEYLPAELAGLLFQAKQRADGQRAAHSSTGYRQEQIFHLRPYFAASAVDTCLCRWSNRSFTLPANAASMDLKSVQACCPAGVAEK